jgi:hypothetical protein
MATSFSGGGSRSTRREPPTLGKQLVNFINCAAQVILLFFLFTAASVLPEKYEVFCVFQVGLYNEL